MPGMRYGLQTVRSSAGAAMAAPGYLPVSNDPSRGAATQRMPTSRRKGDQASLGGTIESLHSPVGSVGHRMVEGSQPESRGGLLNLSWDEIHGIMERAVQRGLGRRQAELVGEIGV